MTAKLLDGKALANKLRAEIARDISERVRKGLSRPGLAVILVGDDPASTVYVRNKRLACEETGMQSFFYPLPDSVKEEELIDLIQTLNNDEAVHGILLQLPLPSHIDSNKLLELIDPAKDVDGFHPYNLGRLAQRRPIIRPCTPYGVMMLLQSIKQTFQHQHAVIIGASNIVGRPMAFELLMEGATVTICHRLTTDISEHVRTADILVSAVGKPGLIKGDWIKPGATVVDIGITRSPDGTLSGDVEFAAAMERAAWITPVPGGVGPMTVAALLQNTLTAAKKLS